MASLGNQAELEKVKLALVTLDKLVCPEHGWRASCQIFILLAFSEVKVSR